MVLSTKGEEGTLKLKAKNKSQLIDLLYTAMYTSQDTEISIGNFTLTIQGYDPNCQWAETIDKARDTGINKWIRKIRRTNQGLWASNRT